MSNLFPDDDLGRELTAAAAHPNANVRAAAAIALGRIGDLAAMDTLVRLLMDPIHAVRQHAAQAAGMLGAPAVGALLGYLEERPEAALQQRLADALGEVRDPEAVDMLAAAVNYLEPPARYGVIEALGAIGDVQAVPALIQATRLDEAGSRHKAAQALLQIGAPEAVTALSALLDDPDPRLRQLTVQGLGKIDGEESVLSLLTALTDSQESVRQATAEALKQIRTPAAEEILLTAIKTNSVWVQQTIAEALGNYPGERVEARLHQLLAEQGDLKIRMIAAQSLARIGDGRGTALIRRTLNAPNAETRRRAAIALGMTGVPDAVPFLIDALQLKGFDPSTPSGRHLHRQLTKAMAAVGPPMLPALLALLGSRDAFIRRTAQVAIAQQGGAAVPALIAAVESHRQGTVRVQAARLLGHMGTNDALQPLAAILRTAQVGPYPVVFISRLFGDRTAGIRAAAATALGQIRSQSAASILLSTARFDPDRAVRRAAETALGRIGDPEVTARFAQVDVLGFVNRVITAGLLFLITGFLSGGVSQLWGLPEAALLAGLVVGAVFGAVDGLRGSKPASQGALIGALAAILLSALLSFFSTPWLSALASVIFPAVGSFFGWQRIQLAERLAGLFVGMVLGFLGAGISVLILGTIS